MRFAKVLGARPFLLYHRGLCALVSLALGVAAASGARAGESEASFQRGGKIPAWISRVTPRKARTWLHATSTMNGSMYVFHVYTVPPGNKTSDSFTYLDVFQSGPAPRRLHHTRLEASYGDPKDGPDAALLWLEPNRKTGPMLVLERYNEIQVAVFPRGLAGPVYTQCWQTGESGNYWMHYALGPVDARGFRTIQEEYQDSEGTSTTLSTWQGNGFK